MRVIPVPVEGEAIQFTEAMALGNEPLPAGVELRRRTVAPDGRLVSHHHRLRNLGWEIGTAVEIGDWIVTGPDGQRESYDHENFQRLFASLDSRSCLSCGISGDGGYEVEDGPGPFCSLCWQKLEEHFLDGLTQAVLRAVVELPDRTSPDDAPGLLAVHENELKEILEGALNERRS